MGSHTPSTIRHLSKPTAVEATTAAEAATAADDRSFSPKPSSTSQRCNELGTEISMSPNMFGRPSCVPFSGQSHLNIFSCPLLLVGLSQNADRASRIVATEIFFLKWLRSCSNFVRGISVMKLSEKLHTTMGLKCTILWSEPSQYFLLSTFVGGT